MAQWLFVLTLLIALLIDTMVALAIWRPKWNLWPPPGKSSWQYRLIWTLYTLLLPGALALALVDAETLPLDAWIGHTTHLLVGGALVAGGSALALWGIRTLTFYASLGLEAQLVTGGPYQYTRNPQYVGDIALALGLAVLSASVLTTLVALATAVGFVLVPFAEEPWLEDHYGAAYVRYRERVRASSVVAHPPRAKSSKPDTCVPYRRPSIHPSTHPPFHTSASPPVHPSTV